MNIVYASNDCYVKHLAVSMCSLFDNNQHAEKITVYILSVNISNENISKLKGIADQFKRELVVCDMSDLKQKLGFNVDTGGFDISTLSRLFIASIMPEQVDRAIYLDCDTVIAGDLLGMWNQDLGECSVAMVMEPTVPLQIKQEIGVAKKESYYNAGVLLIDVAKWRRENTQKRLLDYYKSKGGKLFACDQDTINGALRNEIKSLPPCYNFFTNFKYFRYGQLTRMVPDYAQFTKEEYQNAQKNPVVIHYLGDERPWKNGNYNPYRNYYEKYLDKTPWKDSPKETGMEMYLFGYHILNILTPIVPFLRKAVNRMFGMRIINSRTKKSKK